MSCCSSCYHSSSYILGSVSYLPSLAAPCARSTFAASPIAFAASLQILPKPQKILLQLEQFLLAASFESRATGGGAISVPLPMGTVFEYRWEVWSPYRAYRRMFIRNVTAFRVYLMVWSVKCIGIPVYRSIHKGLEGETNQAQHQRSSSSIIWCRRFKSTYTFSKRDSAECETGCGNDSKVCTYLVSVYRVFREWMSA